MDIGYLRQSMAKRMLLRWDVVHEHVKKETFLPNQGTSLDRNADYHMTVSSSIVNIDTQLASLLDVLETTTVHTGLKVAYSLKWGTYITDRTGKRVFALYLDALRDYGELNGKLVYFSPGIRQWFLDYTKRHFYS